MRPRAIRHVSPIDLRIGRRSIYYPEIGLFRHGLLDTGSPARLDELRPLNRCGSLPERNDI